MPRKRTTPGPLSYIYVMRYVDESVKARIAAGGYAEVGELSATAQLARTEYQAAQAFYRACKAARRDPLAFEVSVQVGQETIIDVTIKH